MVIIPATDHYVISLNYDPTGGEWADMFDNYVLGWLTDDTTGAAPQPVIVGELPPAVVGEPQWVSVRLDQSEGATGADRANVLVPDMWRGNLNGLFDYLASDNRKLRGNFSNYAIANSWSQWAAQHPDQVWDGVVQADEQADAQRDTRHYPKEPGR